MDVAHNKGSHLGRFSWGLGGGVHWWVDNAAVALE